jgi:IclR family pca regulon transcriptional regulator
MVSSRAPCASNASIRLDGMPALPKPPIMMVAPSGMPATACSSDANVLSIMEFAHSSCAIIEHIFVYRTKKSTPMAGRRSSGNSGRLCPHRLQFDHAIDHRLHPAGPQGQASAADEIDALTDPDFMTSLARGLAVIRAFADSRKPQTIAQLSQQTGIPRAAVRRCLHTLRQLGYVDAELNNFSLRPKILTLGYSYLSSTPLTVAAQPCLDGVSKALGESSSLAVLEEDQVLYVARAATARVMSVSLSAGSRLPAYCTSLGRVLLAQLPERAGCLPRPHRAAAEDGAYGHRRGPLREVLAQVSRDGYADQQRGTGTGTALDRGAGARRFRAGAGGAERGRAGGAGAAGADAAGIPAGAAPGRAGTVGAAALNRALRPGRSAGRRRR